MTDPSRTPARKRTEAGPVVPRFADELSFQIVTLAELLPTIRASQAGSAGDRGQKPTVTTRAAKSLTRTQ